MEMRPVSSHLLWNPVTDLNSTVLALGTDALDNILAVAYYELVDNSILLIEREGESWEVSQTTVLQSLHNERLQKAKARI